MMDNSFAIDMRNFDSNHLSFIKNVLFKELRQENIKIFAQARCMFQRFPFFWSC